MTRSMAGTLTDRLRPVVCVLGARHRDVTTADEVRAGRFTHLGVTLDLGRKPNWLDGGLRADEEWRIEWVKFYEGLDLAHAFGATGEEDHLRAWEDLVESFCEQVPVGHDTSDVSARRTTNWMYAWQRFAVVDGFAGLRDGLADRLRRHFEADLDHVEAHLTAERNHRTLELYALLIGGLALDDRPRAARAISLLADNAVADVLPDGVHRERSSDYHGVVLRSLVGAIVNARRADLAVPEQLVARTHLAATVAMHLQRPDGTTPALSDGDEGDFRDVLALAADALGRDDLAWAATAGRRGRPPGERNATFPLGGYAVQRSGWGERRPVELEHWAVFDVGPLGDGGHGHYDHLSVEIAAAGRRLVVDPGRFTYADDAGDWRRWFKGTAAHNTVCVDGLDQTPYRRGKPSGPRSTACLVGRRTIDGLDVVRGRATSPRYDAVHTRALAFVADDYWVAHDLIVGDVDRDCVARWHLDVAALGHTAVEQVDDGAVVRAPGLTMRIVGDVHEAHIEPGWVSAEYGIKHAAPVVAVRARRGRRAELFTAIVPADRDVGLREVPGGPTADGDVDIAIDIVGVIDRIAWDRDVLMTRRERRPC